MFEQLRNELLCKFIFILHNERVAIVRPSNEVGVLFIIQEATYKSALAACGQARITHLASFWTKGGICFLFD